MSGFPSRGDPVALTQALVAIDSRNPALAADGPGESRCARTLGEILTAWGFRVELQDSGGGRQNVIARIGRSGRKGSLLFNGHLDTVGVEGMVHAPWESAVRAGRIFGRGSTDMKGGVAAMCAAAARASEAGLDGEIIVTDRKSVV